jgi:serine/threonine protein kinase
MDEDDSKIDYSSIFSIKKSDVIKVIGEGSYGCVHRPSLKCKNKSLKINYKKKISKLLMKEDAVKESDEYDIIAKYDKQNKYFLGKPIQCDVNITPANIAAIHDCEDGDEFIDNIQDTKLLIMNYGGENLEAIAREFNKMKKTEKNVDLAKKFLVEAKNILSAVNFLHKHKIIHHDLKPQNIVYYKKTNKINLIDFGFTTYKENVINMSKKSNNKLSKCHWSYPLEINFYNHDKYMSFSKYSKEEKSGYYKNIISNINIKENDKCSTSISILFYYIIDKRLSENEKNKIIDKYFNDYKKMLEDVIGCNYKTFLKKSIETIDLYGAGITFYLLLNNMKHLFEKPLIDKLEKLCYNMITPDLFNRIDIPTAIKKYNEILEMFL